MAIFEQPAWSDLAAAWFPILYAGIFSSGIAYTLQIAGQKYADPAVASIVMSLESVFAVLGGFVVLHEFTIKEYFDQEFIRSMNSADGSASFRSIRLMVRRL